MPRSAYGVSANETENALIALPEELAALSLLKH
jgi:hypothetical protein